MNLRCKILSFPFFPSTPLSSSRPSPKQKTTLIYLFIFVIIILSIFLLHQFSLFLFLYTKSFLLLDHKSSLKSIFFFSQATPTLTTKQNPQNNSLKKSFQTVRFWDEKHKHKTNYSSSSSSSSSFSTFYQEFLIQKFCASSNSSPSNSFFILYSFVST